MSIIEYLNTLEPSQKVKIMLKTKGKSQLLAWQYAGALTLSTNPGFLRLVVTETIERKDTDYIYIAVKEPTEKNPLTS